MEESTNEDQEIQRMMIPVLLTEQLSMQFWRSVCLDVITNMQKCNDHSGKSG